MNAIPNAATVADKLEPMNYAQLEELAKLSGVPFHTLLKIRSKETKNPGIETVRQFWPHIRSVARAS